VSGPLAAASTEKPIAFQPFSLGNANERSLRPKAPIGWAGVDNNP